MVADNVGLSKEEIDNINGFLAELTTLSFKYGYYIDNCCCGSSLYLLSDLTDIFKRTDFSYQLNVIDMKKVKWDINTGGALIDFWHSGEEKE